MKRFFSLFTSLVLSGASVIWFSQNSINAYWQQTYHQTSPLEQLSQSQAWATGGQLQTAAYESFEQFKLWLEQQNAQLPVNIAAAKRAAKEQELARLEAEKRAAEQKATAQKAAEAAEAEAEQQKQPALEHAILNTGDKVFFAGDSLMQGVAPHVQQALKRQHGIESVNLSKQSTGLSYPSFFDWPKTIEDTFKKHSNIRLLVMFLGANDPWDFANPKGGAYLRFASPEWEAEYLNRVNRILTAAQQHNAQVIWLSVPFMRQTKLDSQMRYLDKILTQTLHDKVVWLPTANLLSNGADKYSDSVTINGKVVRYRSPDGIHFSPEGQKVLANYVLSKIVVQP